VLDCFSEDKVRLKPYSFADDKFVKNITVCVPKKKKPKKEMINSAQFRTFLMKEKWKILKIQNSLPLVGKPEPCNSKEAIKSSKSNDYKNMVAIEQCL
jgi:hypothetical protein